MCVRAGSNYENVNGFGIPPPPSSAVTLPLLQLSRTAVISLCDHVVLLAPLLTRILKRKEKLSSAAGRPAVFLGHDGSSSSDATQKVSGAA